MRNVPKDSKLNFIFIVVWLAFSAVATSTLHAQSRQAPPGEFQNLDDDIVGDAIVIQGKQLFIDDFIIDELRGTEKVLNQPTKHPHNPLLVRDKPWEQSGPGYGSVMYDERERVFK